MAAPLGLDEPVHLFPPAGTTAGYFQPLYDAQAKVGLTAVGRGARKYAVVVIYSFVACVGMAAWTYFLAQALFRAVEWTLG